MISTDLQQKISRELHLSVRHYQALKLLALPLFQLQQTIDTAVSTNPVIEYEYRPEVSEINDMSVNTDNPHNTFDEEDHFQDYDGGMNDGSGIQEKRDYLFNSYAEERSMQDIFADELKYRDFSPREQELANALTAAIDEKGYLATPLADIAQSCNADIFEAEEMLFKLQKIFPPGIGARDIKECFKLQLEAKNKYTKLFAALLEDLEDFAAGKYDLLRKKHNADNEDIENFAAELRKLDPYPGNALDRSSAQIIIPEAEIISANDGFILKVHDEYIPRIKISENYLQMLDDPSLDAESKAFIKEKIKQAQELCDALDKREKTIVRLAGFIMDNQKDFLYDGGESLRPVTMAQAAEKLELHESTISRTCADKYLKTPHGVFPFKYFFSTGYTSRDGETFSARAIEERIKFYVRDEDALHPLSDEKISNLLYTEGFDIARRTVAKYRAKLHIPPANQRKRHK